MPQQPSTPNFLERLAVLEDQVAQLRRSGWERDELPLHTVSFRGMPYEDDTNFTTVFEDTFAPRTASLALGLVMIGDQVGTTNTGGSWRVVLNITDVVASGTVTPTYTFQYAEQVIDLTPYLSLPTLLIEVQVRRTAGATTGGKFGTGGCIGLTPRYARLL